VRLVGLGQQEADVAVGDAALLAPAFFGEHEIDERAPVFEVFSTRFRRFIAVATQSERRRCAQVGRLIAPSVGQPCEGLQCVRRHGFGGASEASADDLFERAFELGTDFILKRFVLQLRAEWNEFSPLLARRQHAGQQSFAVGERAVAMQQHIADGGAERVVRSAQLHQRTLGCEAVQRLGIGRGRARRAAAGEQRQSCRDLCADRVDGADVEASWVVEQAPAEGGVALENLGGEGAGGGVERGEIFSFRLRASGFRFCLLQLCEDALAQLGGSFAGEGDGEDFFRLRDAFVREQLQVTLHQQAGLAGACRCFDDPRSGDVERVLARFLIGWRGGPREVKDGGVTRHRRPRSLLRRH